MLFKRTKQGLKHQMQPVFCCEDLRNKNSVNW